MGAKGAIKALMTHCCHEVLHAQWMVLLDDEFLEAYEHGIVIKCCDGMTRRFYPRIFTYSADYPEKYASPLLFFLCSSHPTFYINRVLLASIRDKGRCPCPWCLIPLSRVHNLGMLQDMKQRVTLAWVDDDAWKHKVGVAIEIIHEKNYAIESKQVKSLLKEQSLVPITVSPLSKEQFLFGGWCQAVECVFTKAFSIWF